jgi:hypothetical protein
MPEPIEHRGMLLHPRTGVPSAYPNKLADYRLAPANKDTEQSNSDFKNFNRNLLNAWIPDFDFNANPHKCQMDGRTVEEMVRLGFTGLASPDFDSNRAPIPGYVMTLLVCACANN